MLHILERFVDAVCQPDWIEMGTSNENGTGALGRGTELPERQQASNSRTCIRAGRALNGSSVMWPSRSPSPRDCPTEWVSGQTAQVIGTPTCLTNRADERAPGGRSRSQRRTLCREWGSITTNMLSAFKTCCQFYTRLSPGPTPYIVSVEPTR